MNPAKLKIIFGKLQRLLYVELTTLGDVILFALSIPVKGTRFSSNKKAIVYVGEFLPPRIPRIAKWTKRNGDYLAILLCHKHGFYEKFSNPDIDKIFLFRNTWHLRRLIRSLPSPYIVHGFAPKSKYPYFGMSFFRKYHPGIPVVTDYQDVLAIYYGTSPSLRWLKSELPYEKLCMQHSNGIVAHSLEPCEGMKVWGIKDHCKRLFFPLYCDSDSFSKPTRQYSTNDIHIVYAGGVAGSHRDKGHYGGTQFHWLINYLSEQKIHFHIYPSPSVQRADYEEYETIAKQNPYFHFHQAVSQASLSKELSQYHYGIMPFFRENSKQSDLKLKYATTLKLFNYLEAGIPILAGSAIMYQSWLVERYKVGIVIEKMDEFKDLRRLIEREAYNTQADRVIATRELLSLHKHIPRLLKFYESLKTAQG